MGEQKDRQKRSWIGGYVIRDARGRDLYFIRRQINGRRYDVTTACQTLRTAVKQLERFEVDPANYRADRSTAGVSGRLRAGSLGLSRQRGERGHDDDHASQ